MSPVITTGLVVCAGLAAVQLEPPSVEYSMFVTGEPPSNPVMKFAVSWPFARMTEPMTGAAGGLAGTNWRVAETAPVPMALRARSFTS